jgi:hypothetical protein
MSLIDSTVKRFRGMQSAMTSELEMPTPLEPEASFLQRTPLAGHDEEVHRSASMDTFLQDFQCSPTFTPPPTGAPQNRGTGRANEALMVQIKQYFD